MTKLSMMHISQLDKLLKMSNTMEKVVNVSRVEILKHIRKTDSSFILGSIVLYSLLGEK
jgi:hypothetical protein